MDKYHLHWYTDEIQTHAASALASYGLLCDLLANKATHQRRDIWFALVSFLTHAAMISKFLDPIKASAKKRGVELRAHLGVPNESAILPRAARDNLEHFDERIDGWVERNEQRVLEMVFQDREGFKFLRHQSRAIRRVLIADEMVFISEDRNGAPVEMPLVPIYEGIQQLNATCLHKLATESPYNYMLAQALRNYER
jgi:hypothetical protein